ncbi:MAG: LEA type 2 family protein [Bacteroidota bacterium]
MNIRPTKSNILFLITFIIFLASCRQIKELKTFLKCEFKLDTVKDLDLAGVDVQRIANYTDLGWADAAKLLASVAGGSLPLNLTLNVNIKNPNAEKAALNKLEWIMQIDDIDMVSGTTVQRVEVAPGSVSTLPVKISCDLKDVLSTQSAKSLINFGLNLAGSGNEPTRFTLKAKPTIMVGNSAISYPGWIKIKTEYTSQ